MATPQARARDELYNFTCLGCARNRTKRGARLVKGEWRCGACAAVILDAAPLPPEPSAGTVERLEKRGKRKAPSVQAQGLIAYRDRLHRGHRGRV